MKNASKAVFMIKPEGIPYRDSILKILRRAGVAVGPLVEIKMDMETLKKLYGHVRLGTFNKICQQMWGKTCLVGYVFGFDALPRLIRACGDHSLPSRCHPSSIRFQLASHDPLYEHFNVIHRPKTEKENEAHTRAFEALIARQPAEPKLASVTGS
jgi:nucleoside diphosphate kinase